MQSLKQENKHNKVKIIPLGGLEQIGMNITVFEYEDSIIVVDCGLAFPEDDMLGIDLVIPDVTYLKNNISKVKGFVITHGHEDHIGALPYVLKDIPAPVYGTKLTIGLIDNKLKEHNMTKTIKRKVVKHGQSINLGCFRIEFVKTNHSIADASALAIFTPAGIILHTGDFKIDYTPVFGEPADLQRFAELGKKGVLALMCDSTNAIRPGFTMSERTVGRTFDSIFAEHKNNRILVATFASNVDRVQQIINSAYKYGRKVVVEGRSMVNVIGTASELGYINIPEGTLIDIEHLKNYKKEDTVLITTGSQGESMAALSRMAASLHKKGSIMPGDVVVLSSSPIPGNEKAVANVARVTEAGYEGAEILGIHFEGPYLDMEYKGAQPPEAIAVPDVEQFQRYQEAAKGLIRYITLAPEHDEDFALTRYCASHGVIVSMGHSAATYEQALMGIANGATSMTHVFNGMTPFHHRKPGLVGAAFRVRDIYGEVICDGHHSDVASLNNYFTSKGRDCGIMITDSLRAKGCPPGGDYELGGHAIEIGTDGLARLKGTDTIAGSTLRMNQGLRILVEEALVPFDTAVNACTINPARCLGADRRKGRIAAGFDADLTVLDRDYNVLQTWCRGRKCLN